MGQSDLCGVQTKGTLKMIKTTLLALVAATTFSAAAAPAFAADPFGTGSDEMRAFQASATVSELRSRGVNAVAVEEWGDYVRAFVRNDNGGQSMQLFNADTLEPVAR
jgi:hypothetical protein